MNISQREMDHPVPYLPELRAVLVGPDGTGRNLVGNTILGERVFDAGGSKAVRREGVVSGRRVTLVKAPGWYRGYSLCDTPQLVKGEIVLSASLCPPGPHAFILVVEADIPFTDAYRQAMEAHLELLSERVWSHSIVLFTFGECRGERTIEQQIDRKRSLQWLVEKCGNRYHVFGTESKGDDNQVIELLKKIEEMVAGNSGGHFEIQSVELQTIEVKRRRVEERAQERQTRLQVQRGNLRALLKGAHILPELRILMLGWVFAGKSAAGNTILNTDNFEAGGRTMESRKQSGEVFGRQVTIVDTPGWWKFFPEQFNPRSVKSEILKGVSLCSPGPNAFLLMLPADTSFTEDQLRVIQDNMSMLGEKVWEHTVVVFTWGGELGHSTIEQHIESEGEVLQWLVKKCGNRYHVIESRRRDNNTQVMQLLEKIDEMLAGNCFYSLYAETLSPLVTETGPLPEVYRDDGAAEKIGQLLNEEWDRKTWERILKGNRSMNQPISMKGDEAPMEAPRLVERGVNQGTDKMDTSSGGSAETVVDLSEDKRHILRGSPPVDKELGNKWLRLLEKEWGRREMAMIRSLEKTSGSVLSGRDVEELQRSRQKVTAWLKGSSGYFSDEESNTDEFETVINN